MCVWGGTRARESACMVRFHVCGWTRARESACTVRSHVCVRGTGAR